MVSNSSKAANHQQQQQQYGYSRLAELRPGAKVNVYAVIQSMAYAKDLKLMLLDEDEKPVFCQLRHNNQLQDWKLHSDYPLCTGMIVRIHRCNVRGKPNNEMQITGTIGVAGLHIAGWAVDDENFKATFRTSENYTLDPHFDHNRISELRKFWKDRTKKDGIARHLFMANCKEEGVVEEPVEKQPEEEHQNEEDQQQQQFDNSFDEIIGPPDENESRFLEETRSAACPLDDEELEKVQKRLKRWNEKTRDAKPFSKLAFHRRPVGEFFTVNCQVLSILEPSEQYQNDSSKAVYLRVCDGTTVNPESDTRGINPPETHRVTSDLYDNRHDYDSVREFVHHISCFDEFKEEAKRVQPGDLVEIRNCHAKISADYGGNNHMFSLRGLKERTSQNKYNRRIKLLERPEREEGEAGSNGGEAGSSNGGKRRSAEGDRADEEEGPERKKPREQEGTGQRHGQGQGEEDIVELVVKGEAGTDFDAEN